MARAVARPHSRAGRRDLSQIQLVWPGALAPDSIPPYLVIVFQADWRDPKSIVMVLREQWGTMQRVLSSKSRMDRIVEDIIFDFSVQPRLSSQRGNAILVASSIYEACRYFELFQKTPLKGKCAVVTSYNPQAKDVTLEEVGANTETEKQFLFNTYTELLEDVDAWPGKTKTETYEDASRKLFVEQPANMRLLIVVDKQIGRAHV